MTTPLIECPDGTVLEELYGDQMPRLYVEPDRHRLVVPDCPTCALEDAPCGESQAQDVLDWAEAFGYDLDPWQKWSISNILSTLPSGHWAAPDVLLIVARQNGKGTILEVRELAGLFVLGEELLIHTSHEFKTSVNHFDRLKRVLNEYPGLMRRVKRIAGSHGEEAIELKPLPTLIFGSQGTRIRRKVASRLAFQARSRGSGRGFSCDCLVYDEAMILTNEQVGASMPTMSARPNPQMIYAGSAGLEDSVQMAKVRKEMIKKAPRLFAAEWSPVKHTDDCKRDLVNGRALNDYVVCDLHDDRDDPRTWAKANPALGRRLNYDFMLRQLKRMPAEQFDIEILSLGKWPTEEDAWEVISEEKWDSLANYRLGFPTQPIAFGIDIDEDGKSATISAAWDHASTKRVVLEIPRECSRNGSDWVLERMIQLYAKWKPCGIGIPKSGPGAALLDDGKRLWGDRVVPVGTSDEAAAFAWFIQQVREARFWHFGTDAPTLRTAVARASTRNVGDGGKAWSRRDSESDITPVTSATLAAYVLNKKRRGYDPLKSIG